MQTLSNDSQDKFARVKIGQSHSVLLAHRARSLGLTHEAYLESLIAADADRIPDAIPNTWATTSRQLDRLSAAVVLLATIQADLALDLQSLQSQEYASLRTVVRETQKLLAEVKQS